MQRTVRSIVLGLVAVLGSSLTFPFAGVACTTSDDKTLRVGFTWYGHLSTQHYDIDLPLPSLTATSWTQTVISSIGTAFSTSTGREVSLEPCSPLDLPVQ